MPAFSVSASSNARRVASLEIPISGLFIWYNMAYSNSTGLPSVTDVLNPYIDDRWFLPEHQNRGTVVHNACASYLKGLWIPPLLSDHQPYFDSAKRWIDSMVGKVLMVEERLSDNMLGFCGQSDLICILKGDSEPALIDFKTSQAKQKSWQLQIAGYRHLAKKGKDIVTHRGLSVRLKKDGSGCLIDEYSQDYSKDFSIFLSALNAYQFFNERGKHGDKF